MEVMRQNLRCQTYGDTLGTLCKQQWELDWQGHRLLVTTVVRAHPLGGLLVKHHIQSELRQTSLNITTCRCLVTREDITPVTLTINQQILLTQLHQRILD